MQASANLFRMALIKTGVDSSLFKRVMPTTGCQSLDDLDRLTPLELATAVVEANLHGWISHQQVVSLLKHIKFASQLGSGADAPSVNQQRYSEGIIMKLVDENRELRSKCRDLQSQSDHSNEIAANAVCAENYARDEYNELHKLHTELSGMNKQLLSRIDELESLCTIKDEAIMAVSANHDADESYYQKEINRLESLVDSLNKKTSSLVLEIDSLNDIIAALTSSSRAEDAPDDGAQSGWVSRDTLMRMLAASSEHIKTLTAERDALSKQLSSL